MCFPWANVKSLCASGMVATSVRRGWGGSLRRGGATLPASFRLRLLVLGGAALVVLDLLEDLAHAGPHQLSCLDCGLAIAAPDPGGLARVQTFLVGHRSGTPSARHRRRSRITPANRSGDPATSVTTIGRTTGVAMGVSVGAFVGMSAAGGGTTPGPKSSIAS